MKCKVGDKIIIIKTRYSWCCINEHREGKKIHKEIAKITSIDNTLYTVDLYKCSNKKIFKYYNNLGVSTPRESGCGHIFTNSDTIISISNLKLKKLIEHGV